MPSKTNNTLFALFVAFNIFLLSVADTCNPSPIPVPVSVPVPVPSVSDATTCPTDALKLGVCANVLGPLLGLVVGNPPVKPCCSLIEGLVDLEAAICLCTAIKANVLGINLNVPLSLTLLLNICSKNVPKDFQCA